MPANNWRIPLEFHRKSLIIIYPYLKDKWAVVVVATLYFSDHNLVWSARWPRALHFHNIVVHVEAGRNADVFFRSKAFGKVSFIVVLDKLCSQLYSRINYGEKQRIASIHYIRRIKSEIAGKGCPTSSCVPSNKDMNVFISLLEGTQLEMMLLWRLRCSCLFC